MAKFTTSFAGSPKSEASYVLTVDDQRIKVEFFVEASASLHPTAKGGSFFEGLWHFDCGELWLASATSERYLEFNLAPNGAWWSCPFSGRRTRDTECIPPRVTTECQILEGTWRASLEVSWEEVRRCLGDSEEPLCNVTLVLGGCPDFDVPLENLHTVAPLDAVDFHRPQDWIPLAVFPR